MVRFAFDNMHTITVITFNTREPTALRVESGAGWRAGVHILERFTDYCMAFTIPGLVIKAREWRSGSPGCLPLFPPTVGDIPFPIVCEYATVCFSSIG
jgi:hypothetical protein